MEEESLQQTDSPWALFSDSPTRLRAAQVPKTRFILLHYSIAKTLWDAVILLATFFIAVCTPFEVAFRAHEEEHWPLIEVEIAMDVLFVLDIILHFRTTYLDSSGQVVYDGRSIALHYLRTWFFVDFIAVLPFDFIHTMPSFHLLKAVRLLHLLRLVQKLDRYSHISSFVLTFLMSMYVLLAHWMACIFFLIGQYDLKTDHWTVGWLYQLGESLETPYINSSFGGPSVRDSYVAALYFSLTSLTTVGFGNVSANTNAEMIFIICLMLIGGLMHDMIFSNMMAIIQRLYTRRSMFCRNKIHNYIRTHRLNPELKHRLLAHVQMSNSCRNANKLFKDFPENLRAEINLFLYKDLLQLPLFSAASDGSLRALALHVQSTFCVPNQQMYLQGEVLDALHLLCSGRLEVLRDNQVVALLESGSLFGCDLPGPQDIAKAKADVRAVTHCVLQSLSLRGLREVLESYPELTPAFTTDTDHSLTYNLQERDTQQDCIIPQPDRALPSTQELPESSAQGHRRKECWGATVQDPDQEALTTQNNTEIQDAARKRRISQRRHRQRDFL